MIEIIKNVLSKNAIIIAERKTAIKFEKDFNGKGLLNKEISKLYNKKNRITEKEVADIIINSHVIIEKMAKLPKCDWKISELEAQLESGIAYYKTGKQNYLNATAIGQYFEISSQRLNLILSELGWIEKDISGWKLSKHGKELGGKEHEHDTSGHTYVVWPDNILLNINLTDVFKEIPSVVEQQKKNPAEKEINDVKNNLDNFREKFPPTLRTKDGHMVRSRAEVIIDNSLYDYKLAHAYERKVPIEEDLYCDFFIPKENVYIEFWGMENDPKYAARKKIKLELYRKYDFKLIELTDEDLANLDEILTKKLLKFGIKVYG